jgi:hypothetical protein
MKMMAEKQLSFSIGDPMTALLLRWTVTYNEHLILSSTIEKITDIASGADFLWTRPLSVDIDAAPQWFLEPLFASLSRDMSAPYEAAVAGSFESLELLMPVWNNINERDIEGRTALYWAAFKGHEAVAKLLLENGADPSLSYQVKDTNWTPIYWAQEMRHIAIEDMLKRKIRQNEQNEHSESEEST